MLIVKLSTLLMLKLGCDLVGDSWKIFSGWQIYMCFGLCTTFSASMSRTWLDIAFFMPVDNIVLMARCFMGLSDTYKRISRVSIISKGESGRRSHRRSRMASRGSSTWLTV